MTKPASARYRTENWKSYDEALKRRGSLLAWPDRDMVWFASRTGSQGRPPVFGDAAVQFRRMVKVLFGLPLLQPSRPVPDFSTLSRRQARITAQITNRRGRGPPNLLFDRTGIKHFGDGEWLAHKHGTHRRCPCRKVRSAMDADNGDLRAVEFT